MVRFSLFIGSRHYPPFEGGKNRFAIMQPKTVEKGEKTTKKKEKKPARPHGKKIFTARETTFFF